MVEAVYENMALKKEIFAKLDKICKPSAILATNTSALSIDEVGVVITVDSRYVNRIPVPVMVAEWLLGGMQLV